MSWMDELYDHPPLWVSHGAGSRFWDLDGHEYVDMYVADVSAFSGHAPVPVVRAVSERIAAGNQFLLPCEDALVVAEELARRYGMAKWQSRAHARDPRGWQGLAGTYRPADGGHP